MTAWLNVAEKPSVAKEATNVLSRGTFRSVTSSSRFNPVFEFSFEGKTMLFTSVAGHMMESEFPPNAKSWSSYPFQNLFTANITKSVRKDMEPLKRNLEILARRASHLVLWLDCDREGENICFEVISVAISAHRNLAIKRAHFSALTARDLFAAMHNLKAPDQKLSDAVETRQEMDLRVGAVFTRFQTVKFRDAFANMPRLLSFGPCQFPTLGFVVRRHLQREAFTPEDFFTLQMADGANSTFHGVRGRVYDQITATILFEAMLARAAPDMEAVVTSVVQRPVRKHPPVPLATVVMQKLASTHLRMSSERCMAEAESLYQEGYISYPRTETDSFAFTDEELLELVQVQKENSQVSEFVERMLADTPNRFRRPLRGSHDDNAHPPIHPTKVFNVRGDSNNPRESLYLLIVRHFLACVSPDAVAATTTATAVFGGETFETSGTTIIDRGWMEVFTYERWNGSCIPNYQPQARFKPTSVTLDKGRTSPPAHLTEAQLITLMDENGIGTDATIAQHIKTIQDREYVKKEGQFFLPTPLGLALSAAYEEVGLSKLLDPEPRAQMELAMLDIVRGTATKQDVLTAAVAMYRSLFTTLEKSASLFRQALARHLQLTARESELNGGAGGDFGGSFGARALDGAGAPGGSSDRGFVFSSMSAQELAALPVVSRGISQCGVCRSSMDLVATVQQNSHGGANRSGSAAPSRTLRAARCLTCSKAYRLPSYELSELSPHTMSCVACKFGVISVLNTESGRSHTLCPYCFTNPPSQCITDDLEDAGGFRCFNCTLDCPLAKGMENVSIMPCISCHSNDIRLRSSSSGFFLACRGFPACSFTVSLPRAQSIVPDPTQRCPQCQAVMLKFTFAPGSQIPGLDAQEVICASCDGRLRDYIVVKGYAPQSDATSGSAGMPTQNTATNAGQSYEMPDVPTTRRRGGGGGGGSGAASRGRGRGRGGGRGGASDGNAAGGNVNCLCSQPARQLTSRKEASMGKKFWTCANRQCNFFEWAAES